LAGGSNASPWIRGGLDYNNKAFYFANRLGLDDQPASPLLAIRNGAWSEGIVSEQLIPASRVFNRVKSYTDPSTAEVERALDQLVAAAVSALPDEAATTGADTASAEVLVANDGSTGAASSTAVGAEGMAAAANCATALQEPDPPLLVRAPSCAPPPLASRPDPVGDMGLAMQNLGLSVAQEPPDQAAMPTAGAELALAVDDQNWHDWWNRSDHLPKPVRPVWSTCSKCKIDFTIG